MKLITTTLVLLLAITACKQDRTVSFSKFEIEINLSFKTANISQNYRSANINKIDSFIILLNTFGADQQIHIYDDNFKYITSTGNVGPGPREINNPFQGVLETQKRVIWIMDVARGKILRFQLDSILKNPDYFPKEMVSTPKDYPFIISYKPFSDSIFSFIQVLQKENYITFFNTKGELIDAMSIKDNLKLHSNEIEDNYDQLAFLYCMHPNRKLFAIAYRYSDIITIVDREGKIVKEIKGPTKIDQIPNSTDLYKLETARSIQCDDKYIYRLYNGESVFVKDDPAPRHPKQLQIFDWEGNPIANIQFDLPVTSIAVDRNKKTIYAFSAESTDIVFCDFPTNLIKYQL